MVYPFRTWLSLLLFSFYLPCALSVKTDNAGTVFQQRVDTLQQKLKLWQNPSALQLKQLAESQVLEYWDIQGSIIALIGRSQWTALAENKKIELSNAFKNTLIRYFMEIYGYYMGQRIRIDQTQLNPSGDKGWVRLMIDMDYLPEFPVDVKVVKSDKIWKYQDIRVQGISYVQMKRNYFSETIKKQGVSYLITELNKKNLAFFRQRKLLSAP